MIEQEHQQHLFWLQDEDDIHRYRIHIMFPVLYVRFGFNNSILSC